MNLKNSWMNDMKMEELAPLIISTCIEFLEQSPRCTKYHPEQNVFILDSKVIARIIRYEGNLRAQIDQTETRFFTKLLTEGLKYNVIDSPIRKAKYSIQDYSKFNTFSVKLEKIGGLRVLSGMKPKYIGDTKYVPVAND